MATVANGSKPLVKDLHEHIVCPLCRGYLIDATTLVECLHSFCRGCIVRRLGSGARACPVCGAVTLPPLLPDLALQRLVYLAVPGLYRSELDRRRHFRSVNLQYPPPAPPLGALALTLDDAVSLSLCEILNDDEQEELKAIEKRDDENPASKRQIRYLKCPAAVTVRHLVRLLALKRGWGDTEGKSTPKRIEMLYENVNADDGKTEMHLLELSWTLLDLACIFKWDKETPMKLYYRVVKREETPMIQQPRPISSYNIAATSDDAPPANVSGLGGGSSNPIIENVQRPPTPPPSPKQSNSDARTIPQAESKPKSTGSTSNVNDQTKETESVETEESHPASPTGNAASQSDANNIVSGVETSGSGHGTKIKKPRCEVTPVMRAPGPQGSGVSPALTGEGNNKGSSKVGRMEHHKRRKRRNKRLIAEITTTPREDLLKLKVRLTPCPPRITSSAGSAKEKVLQLRAVRREKIKHNAASERNQSPPPPPPPILPLVTQSQTNVQMPLTPPPSASAETATMPIIMEAKVKETEQQEETIEEIIDGIPDEVVRVAQQNMNGCNTAVASSPASGEADKIKSSAVAVLTDKNKPAPAPAPVHNEKAEADVKADSKKKLPAEVEIIGSSSGNGVVVVSVKDNKSQQGAEPPLSLSTPTPTPKPKPTTTTQQQQEKPKDEVMRRLGLVAISEASKNRQDKIRASQIGGGSGTGGIDYHRESLERQLRESRANRVRSLLAEKQMRDALKSMMSKSVKPGKGSGSGNGPKKGPPPLAPLTPKQGSNFSNPPKSSHPVNHPQISSRDNRETTGKNETPLDLSKAHALDLSPAPSGSGNPAITSTTFPATVHPKSRSNKESKAGAGAGGVTGNGKSTEDKKNQDLNLRTLSDAAVSLLSTGPATGDGRTTIGNSTVLSNKVALRIPQPHQRISGFGNGMKIKPNLAVRHIPNPQAFVASQYRNQRNNFFTTVQQQPP